MAPDQLARLAALLEYPCKARDLASDQAAALLGELALLQAALAARLAVQPPPTPASSAQADGDRLLTPEQAAERLGVTAPWLYRHAGQLPFTRRLSRKALRFWEPGLVRWMREKRP